MEMPNSILSLVHVRGPGPLGSLPRAFDLELEPRDMALVDARDVPLASGFTDLCCGLNAPLEGNVRFLGRDWARQPRRVADALRGLIGRVLYHPGWFHFLDADSNVFLQQLYHTRADIRDLRAQATKLALHFGLPGLPVGPIAGLSQSDLIRLGLIRTFLGSPRLVILESPVQGLHRDIVPPLLNTLLELRDRGGAAIWLTRSRMIWDSIQFPATRRFTIDHLGLTEMAKT